MAFLLLNFLDHVWDSEFFLNISDFGFWRAILHRNNKLFRAKMEKLRFHKPVCSKEINVLNLVLSRNELPNVIGENQNHQAENEEHSDLLGNDSHLGGRLFPSDSFNQ